MPASFYAMSLREIYDVINITNARRRDDFEAEMKAKEIITARVAYQQAQLIAIAVLDQTKFPSTLQAAFPYLFEESFTDQARTKKLEPWEIEKVRMKEWVSEYNAIKGTKYKRKEQTW